MIGLKPCGQITFSDSNQWVIQLMFEIKLIKLKFYSVEIRTQEL
jgi:hypothetical protein